MDQDNYWIKTGLILDQDNINDHDRTNDQDRTNIGSRQGQYMRLKTSSIMDQGWIN